MTTTLQTQGLRWIVIGRTSAGQPRTYRLVRHGARPARIVIVLRKIVP